MAVTLIPSKMTNPFETIERKLDTLHELILTLKGGEDIPQPTQPRYLTRLQAAELLHLTLPTLHVYTQAGIIRGHKVGRRVLYSEEDIKAAVQAIPTLKYGRRR